MALWKPLSDFADGRTPLYPDGLFASLDLETIMLPDAQHFMRPGIVEFTWGHPDLALFPTEGLAQAAALALIAR